MADFEIIPATERPPRGLGRGPAPYPVTVALRAGKTVFVPLNGKSPRAVRARYHTAARRSGHTAHVRSAERHGEPGVIVWFEERS